MRLASTIIHQQQPTNVSCTPTCIAMALGMPVSDMGVGLERPFAFHHFGVWLAERGIWLRPVMRLGQDGEPLRQGHVYLVAVRSKNIVGGDHAVLVDTRGEPTNSNPRSGWKTFDPNAGRAEKAVWDWADEYYGMEICELCDRDTYGGAGAPPTDAPAAVPESTP